MSADASLVRLGRALPDDGLVTDPDVVSAHSQDQATQVPAGKAVALARPQTAEQVAAVLAWASAERVPVVARGAGSGLSGGATATDGCVIVSLEGMNRLCDVDPVDGVAVTEPGVITADVKAAAASEGLWYPPDPASAAFCTIGGNIATNAGGLCCLKYGVTRDYVLALDVVLADGTRVTTGRRTLKGVAGYDLTALLVGSEGTLGIVTRARVRLRAAQPPRTTLVALFDDTGKATRACMAALVDGADLSLLEYVDRVTLTAINDWRRIGIPADADALVVAQSDAAGDGAGSAIDVLADHCTRNDALYVTASSDADESEALLEARRLAYPSLERLGATLLDDVCVPRSEIPTLVRGVEEIAATSGCLIGTFGHLGDGNMHPTLVFDAHDADAVRRANDAFAAIVDLAVDLGGTVTGEHGVGLLKTPYLRTELGDPLLAVQRRIKDALDPAGILNPGKKL